MSSAEDKNMETHFLECSRNDLFKKEPFVFNVLAKEEKYVVVRGLDEILIFREQILLYIQNNYSPKVFQDIKRFLLEAIIPENEAINALVNTFKLFRNSRFISCLFIDLISRFGLPSPIMIEPGHMRLLALTRYEKLRNDPRFHISNFEYPFPRDDFEPIFSAAPVSAHRDLNFPHYTFQMNFWFPFHDLAEEDALILLPDAYRQPLASYPQVDSGLAPEKLEYGRTSQVKLNFGDLLMFHSEQFHASPVQDLNTRRLTCEMRLSAGCIDDNAVYRRHFWHLNNFLPKRSSSDSQENPLCAVEMSSSRDRAVSLIQNVDSKYLTLTKLQKDRPDLITSQHYLNAMFKDFDEALTYTDINNSTPLYNQPKNVHNLRRLFSRSKFYLQILLQHHLFDSRLLTEWETPTLLAENVHGFNIVGYGSIVFAIPRSEGTFDINRIKNQGYSCTFQGPDCQTVTDEIRNQFLKSSTINWETTDNLTINLYDSFPFSEDRAIALARVFLANESLGSSLAVLENLIHETASYFWALVVSRWFIRLKQFKLAKLALSKAISLAESSPICDGRYCPKLPLQNTYRLQFYPEDAVRAGKALLKNIEGLDPETTSPNFLKTLDFRIFSPQPYQFGEYFSYNVYKSGTLMVGLSKKYEFDPDVLINKETSGVLVNDNPGEVYRDIYSKESSNVDLNPAKADLVGYFETVNIVLWQSQFYTVPKNLGHINFFSESNQHIKETHKELDIRIFISAESVRCLNLRYRPDLER